MPPPSDIAKAHAAVRDAIADGRVFAAYDLARAGLEAHPDDDELRLLAVIALVRTGATDAAREELANTHIAGHTAKKAARAGEAGLLLAEALEAIGEHGTDPEELERAQAIRLERAATGRRFADAARAASLARKLGDQGQAAKLAGAAMQRAPKAKDAPPEVLLDLAEIAVILDHQEQAGQHLERLADRVAAQPMQRMLARRRLTALLAEGAAVAADWLDLFEPARVVIFTGTRPADERETFTAALQAALNDEIAHVFDQLRPEIAFGSASAGCDLLFTEALLARGAELNIVLPFERHDFRRRFVEPHGSTWIERFEHALAAAASVVEVCREPYLGDDVILRFGNQVIDGTARLRGAALASPPHLIAVWDYLAEPLSGSPSDFIDHWGDPGRLRLIDLDELLSEPPAGAPERPGSEEGAVQPEQGEQRIATLLFADVVGYSQLRDDELLRFWRFMQAVTTHMKDAPAARMVDSWGDALLAVHDRALDAADYGLALCEAFASLDSRHFGLGERLQLRIALHAGPAFESHHPLTGQRLVYGGNVNRAARIEPITIPGHVYASEQFVAMVTAEESAAEAEVRLRGGVHRPRHRCTYRGVLDLAKGYGSQSIYEITPWRAEPGAVELVAGEHLHVVLNNELGEHRHLADLFGRLIAPSAVPDEMASLFEIVFDEVLTNICRYAWSDDALHAIDVEVALTEGRIEATFRDDGDAFDPLEVPAAELVDDLDERAIGGLGIHLVRELMDEVRYAREDGFNCLTIIKRIGEEPVEKSAGKEAS